MEFAKPHISLSDAGFSGGQDSLNFYQIVPVGKARVNRRRGRAPVTFGMSREVTGKTHALTSAFQIQTSDAFPGTWKVFLPRSINIQSTFKWQQVAGVALEYSAKELAVRLPHIPDDY
jgi:hypothetical protein